MKLLDKIYNEVFDFNILQTHPILTVCRYRFPNYVTYGVSNFIIHQDMLDNDLYLLAEHIDSNLDDTIPENVLEFMYENMLLRANDMVFETPQYFFMRLAMHKYQGHTDSILSAYKYYANTLDLSELGKDFVFYGLRDEIRQINRDNDFDYSQYFKGDFVIK